MGGRRASCKRCGRHKSETYISKRGLCTTCATTNYVLVMARMMADGEGRAKAAQRAKEGDGTPAAVPERAGRRRKGWTT